MFLQKTPINVTEIPGERLRNRQTMSIVSGQPIKNKKVQDVQISATGSCDPRPNSSTHSVFFFTYQGLRKSISATFCFYARSVST